MKSVLFSIRKRHADNIISGKKIIELRTRAPKTELPYKAYLYETKGIWEGSGKVIAEWTVKEQTTYRICVGIPSYLVECGCVSAAEINNYTNGGEKDLVAIGIDDLIVYDTPKELNEFTANGNKLNTPPQSWRYIDAAEVNYDNQEKK